MLEDKVKFLSEGLARTVDRRNFIKRTGNYLFASVATLAAGQSLITRASAADGGGVKLSPFPTPQCSPPGPYCNTGGGILSGCHGAHCFQHLYNGQILQCHLIYWWYPTGCWTTQGNPHWTCCDCGCGPDYQNPETTCGCAQYSGTPAPLPMAPGGK